MSLPHRPAFDDEKAYYLIPMAVELHTVPERSNTETYFDIPEQTIGQTG